jgi:integrase
MSKRANGSGSIYYSQAQKTWVGEILLPDGKKKRKRNKLQRVVRTWLDVQKESVRRGEWVSNENTRYGDFIDRYMREVAIHSLRPKTFESYTYTINSHIKPTLGGLRITAIRPEHLQHLYSKILESGLSKHTVKYIHAIIRKTLGVAMKSGLVMRNVADLVTPPTPDFIEIKPLTVEEVKRFLKVLENDRLYAFYVLIATTGIRKGEALGLQKESLSLDDGVISIRHSLSQINGKGLVLGEPKSKMSRRDIALTEFTVDALTRHLKDHPNNSKYVFATSNNTPFSPRNILRHFKSKLEEAGLPQDTRVHTLRHSIISWLLASGVSVKDVQMIAGHSQPHVTLKTYAHVMPNYNRKVAIKIEGMFAEGEQ